MTSLTFANPFWLGLALLSIPLGVVAWRWFGAMTRVRRASAVLARTLLLVLLASALAGAATVKRTDRLAVVAVVDVSDSARRGGTVGAEVYLDRVRTWLVDAFETRGPDDLAGIVVFDGRSLAVATPARADIAERRLDVRGAEGSDLAGALRYAAALIPADAAGRLVLISDGNETVGDAVATARELASAGSAGGVRTPVDAVPVRYNVEREVIVERVDAPPRAPESSTVAVRVVLRATAPVTGTLRLLREGEPIDANGPGVPGTGRRVAFGPGRLVERFEHELDSGRIHRWEAVFEPDPPAAGQAAPDTYAENNRGESVTLTPGSGSVLLVDGVGRGDRRGAGATLAKSLEAGGLAVDLRSPAGVPTDLLGLEAFDLIVLQNVPAEEFGERGAAMLSAYVREMGGGLVMIGGPDSFGAGGWKGTPVEHILPVSLDLPERLVTPETAIVFVLDRSGSMSSSVGGSTRSQQQVANEAAALAIRSLDEQDLVGVIAFSNGFDVVRDLAPNGNAGATVERVLAIGSGGGTNIGPALAAAGAQLANVDAKTKHVIVLTDGQSIAADTLADVAADLRNEQDIRVSTIAVGNNADENTLEQMAIRGGGVYYPVRNPSTLPRIFLKAVRVVRTPMIREQPFDPIVTGSGSPLTQGLGTPPTLGGLALTQPRPDPTVTDAMITPTGEPLLSHWAAGLGQVVAFTSDAHLWARDWVAWPGYRDLWTRVVRLAARSPSARTGTLAVTPSDDGLRLRYEAIDAEGRPVDLLNVRGTVFGPEGEARGVHLEQVGPGVYEAAAPAFGSGTHVAVIRPAIGQTALQPITGGATLTGGVESRALSSDDRLMRDVAAASEGRVYDLGQPAPADLFDRTDVPVRTASTPLWPVLLAWSLGVLLLDIGTRRIAWDRFVSRSFGAGPAVLEDRSAAARATVSGLRSKQRRTTAEPVRGTSGPLRTPDPAPVAEPAPIRPSPDPRPTNKATPAPDEPSAEGTAGLLAAKRRARARLDEE